MTAASGSSSLIHLNRGRSSLGQVTDHSRDKGSRGRVSRNVLDSTSAAIHSPRDHIATADHTRGVSAKRHTELLAAAVAADRSRVAGHNRLAGYSVMTDHKREAARTRQTGCSRVAGSWAAGHKQEADRKVMGLRPRLRRDQERPAAPPW
jgi:hypothetical protein